ncbi:hypothetical protein CLV56_1572 [Mumia flava]|uniref:VIT family protein n=1 Tax=Mumia flava TaxID=1348852 RepID=A0A2M9BHB7_9ACTN|nr:hypothetical protein [Mumia flava]PJJ57345.1 hypothetical protein CLV56_1572 [Mumia flava]
MRRPSAGAVTPHMKGLAVERLRERIYVTFTSIAVLYTLSLHAEGLSPGSVAATLAITGIGTVLATSAAEVIAHVFVYGESLSREHLGRMTKVAAGALSALVVPILVIVLAGWDWWDLDTALTVSVDVLVVTLALIVWSGVRRTSASPFRKVLAVLSLSVLALVVIALKSVAH